MPLQKIVGIAACDPKGVMGKEGNLPWHSPEELKHFSETILHHPIIMGSRTFLSLPDSYFDRRMAIVFTRQKPPIHQKSTLFFVSSLIAFFALELPSTELYLIGGAQMYTLFLKENLLSEFILTRFKDHYDGETFFPLSLLESWPTLKIQETNTFNIHRYFNLSIRN
jgi:dihydrofolate reductase